MGPVNNRVHLVWAGRIEVPNHDPIARLSKGPHTHIMPSPLRQIHIMRSLRQVCTRQIMASDTLAKCSHSHYATNTPEA